MALKLQDSIFQVFYYEDSCIYQGRNDQIWSGQVWSQIYGLTMHACIILLKRVKHTHYGDLEACPEEDVRSSEIISDVVCGKSAGVGWSAWVWGLLYKPRAQSTHKMGEGMVLQCELMHWAPLQHGFWLSKNLLEEYKVLPMIGLVRKTPEWHFKIFTLIAIHLKDLTTEHVTFHNQHAT